MKKLKLLPSVLMMIMCVGILAVGVFAISPIVSTIGGKLSISAAQGVKVGVYNSQGMTAGSLVDSAFGGVATEVNLGEISLDGSTASTASDVTPKVFYIKLTTNQDKNYVVDTETIEYIDGVGATSGEKIKNAGLVTKMHTFTATDVKGRACFNKTNPYTIKLSIKCGALTTEVVNMAFNLQLNIYEENDSNFTDTEINGVDYLYFGSYPQSLESETLTGYEPTGETYGAYDDNGGETTRDVYKKTGDTSGDRFVELDSKLYKIEPLKWDILDQAKTGSLANTEEGNTLLVSDLVLEQVPFYTSISNRTIDGKTIYASTYAYSTLRNFLTTTFYANAFKSIQQELIKISTVKNSKDTTNSSIFDNAKFIDVEDLVFALSYQEALNTVFGHPNSIYGTISRSKHASAYSKATGTNVQFENVQAIWDFAESKGYENSEAGSKQYLIAQGVAEAEIDDLYNALVGAGDWLLRSPNPNYEYNGWSVNYLGRMQAMQVNKMGYGCVPAMHIAL